jgi:hypothetical protein
MMYLPVHENGRSSADAVQMEATMDEVTLLPHDPQAICPMCSRDEVSAVYHAAPIMPFHAPGQPCSPFAFDNPMPFGAHQCRKCRNCGYGWIESPATEGDPMSIRKTGAAEDQALQGIDSPDGDDAGAIRREAAAAWGPSSEAELILENETADGEE